MSTDASETAPTRRGRGRRPAGQETRDALLAAARVVFTENGFDRATSRAIAARAGVDAAMVNHWFGGKSGLFVAAMQLPVDPEDIVARVLDGPADGVGERVVRTFLGVWDQTDGGPLVALLRSVSGHEGAARMFREFITKVVVGRVVRAYATDHVDLRIGLCAAQIAGLGLVRYVVKLEPLASAGHDTVVAAIAPTLQRYITGPVT